MLKAGHNSKIINYSTLLRFLIKELSTTHSDLCGAFRVILNAYIANLAAAAQFV